MSRRRTSAEEGLDNLVGRATETAGSLTGDETLEAEGRTLARKGRRNSYRVVSQPEEGWIVENGDSGQVVSVHPTKEEAVQSATSLARDTAPSQLLVYKKDGTVQSERLYG